MISELDKEKKKMFGGLVSYDSDTDDEKCNDVSGAPQVPFVNPIDAPLVVKGIVERTEVEMKLTPIDTTIDSFVEVKEIKDNNPQKSHFLDSLPPLVHVGVNPETVETIRHFMAKGKDYNLADSLRKQRSFRNPYILQEVVKQLNIDEIGSNYPTHLFDPHSYQERDFIDSIKRRYSQYTSPPDVALADSLSFSSSHSSFASSLSQVPASVTVPQPAPVSGLPRTKKSRWDEGAAIVPGQSSVLK